MNTPARRYASFAVLVTLAFTGPHPAALAQEVAVISQSGQVVARSSTSGQPAEARLGPGPFEVRLPRVDPDDGVHACASTDPTALVSEWTGILIDLLRCFESAKYTVQADGPVQSMLVGVGDNNLYFDSDDRTDSASSTLLRFRGVEYVDGAAGPFYLSVILDRDRDDVLDRGEYHQFRVELSPQGASASAQSGSEEVRMAGTLSSGDLTLVGGESMDGYSVEVGQGQWLKVDLRSSAFDPYLIIRTPSNHQSENDDVEGDRTRSEVVLQATEAGQYQIIVTSYGVGEAGAYTLVHEVTGTDPRHGVVPGTGARRPAAETQTVKP